MSYNEVREFVLALQYGAENFRNVSRCKFDICFYLDPLNSKDSTSRKHKTEVTSAPGRVE